jgi:ligand-binding SRPBCC domain-containing protein
MAVKTYALSFAQQVARPLPEVFGFFSRAENLEALTPPWLNFKILDVKPSQYNRELSSITVCASMAFVCAGPVKSLNGNRRTVLSISNSAALTNCGGMSIVLKLAKAER